MRIAIVGSGIAGLTCAHLLHSRHDITVFEADDRAGGHTNTVRVELEGETHHIDTGFIVYNERNYPGLVRLLAQLGVATQPSDMSFSVSDEHSGVEWRGSSPGTVFAQRQNVARPQFHRMLFDVARFNRAARRLLDAPSDDALTLGAFLQQGKWSEAFREWYLVPLGSAIWSATAEGILEFPATSFARFFDNHGLLRLGDQPSWRTVTGGAARYVDAIVEPLGDRLRLGSPVGKIVRRAGGIELTTQRHGPETFDQVIVAAHSDQALRLLSDPSDAERQVLGAIAYRPNRAVLHTDARVLPRQRRAWASWNYHRGTEPDAGATLTYDLNRLQSIDSRHRFCVTLNRPDAVDPSTVLASIDYAHPVFDAGAMAAQRRYGEISGRSGTWFCGAYWGYGFHEDGVQSALRVCRALGADW